VALVREREAAFDSVYERMGSFGATLHLYMSPRRAPIFKEPG
jgi:hypothetical protein